MKERGNFDEKYVRLDEACDVIMGQSPDSSSYNEKGDGLPFFQGNADFGEYFPVVRMWCNAPKKIVEKDTILISVRAPIGAVNISDRKCCIGRGLAGMVPKDEYELKYMYYALKGKHLELNSKGTGSTFKAISKNILGETLIRRLSKTEQEDCIKKLDCLSSIIARRKQQLDKYDEIMRARFVEMFGDCRTNPMDWTTNQLGDVAEVGSSKRVFVEELKDTGIPFYRGTEVGALAEGKQITPELYITEQHYKELCNASGTPQRGDLLMPSICPDGRIWVVDTDEPFYFKDGRVLWVHEICNSYNPTFLLYTLKDRIMTDYSSIASGTTFAELKIFALKTCKVFDVPLALQEQFAAFVRQTDKSKAVAQKALDETQMLFDSLMQEYFG